MNAFDGMSEKLAYQIIKDLGLKRGSGSSPEVEAKIKLRLREITGGPEKIEQFLPKARSCNDVR